MSLTGRTAVVTGAGRNIGRAIALALAAEGANIVVNVRANGGDADDVVSEVKQHGVHAIPILADMGQQSDVERLIEASLQEFSTVDILVNNVGMRQKKPLLEVSYEDMRSVMAVNFESGFRLTQGFLPGMIEQNWGRVINNVGLNSFSGQPNRSHIAAAKMATLGLTRSLGQELAPHGVLVNCLSPGAIDTTEDSSAKAALEARRESIPVGRLGQPEDIADMCVFLASDRASFITGQLFHVNGGERCF